MDFENASHGVNFNGMRQLKEDIKVNVFDSVKEAVRNTTDVEAKVKEGWQGTAADNFIHNIQVGSEKLCENLNQIQDMLMTELDGIQSQIGEMDENLVEREG